MDIDLLNRKGVVYQLTCLKCEEAGSKTTYIGETGRVLKERINEHFTRYKNRSKLSEVGAHCINVHNFIRKEGWKLEILCDESDSFRRKAAESLFIDKL